jgi:hypothetical protein
MPLNKLTMLLGVLALSSVAVTVAAEESSKGKTFGLDACGRIPWTCSHIQALPCHQSHSARRRLRRKNDGRDLGHAASPWSALNKMAHDAANRDEQEDWGCMGGGGDEDWGSMGGGNHDGHHSCETLEENEAFQRCIQKPAGCTELYAARPSLAGNSTALPTTPLGGPVCAGAALSGRRWGERRYLTSEQLCGTVPTEVGLLINLTDLCVPTPPPHLAMWRQLSTRGRLMGEGGECSRGGFFSACGCAALSAECTAAVGVASAGRCTTIISRARCPPSWDV